MSRKGENITKRKDGRWEARYIKGRDLNGKAVYGYLYAHSYAEAREKKRIALQEPHQSIACRNSTSQSRMQRDMIRKDMLAQMSTTISTKSSVPSVVRVRREK